VLSTFNEYEKDLLPYHNYRHTFEIVQKINDLANASEASATETEVAVLAAWFIDVGYVMEYSKQAQASLDFARQALKSYDYNDVLIELVCETLRSYHSGESPNTVPSKILKDAANAVDFGKSFKKNSALRKLEIERLTKQSIEDGAWTDKISRELESTRFYSDYAKIQYTPYLMENLQWLNRNKRANTNGGTRRIEGNTSGENFEGIEEAIPEKAIQTYFRSNYRNHINLSAIADNKANIMISVNAIIISILISILTYQDLADQSPFVFMPSVVFIITGITSLTFAILSARPKVTSVINHESSPEDIQNNLVFFGNFSQLHVDDYETAMDQMFKDGKLIYRNMTRDMYYLGLVLNKKYQYLRYSYTVFMVGLLCTVVLFLLLFLI
jgi:hypothetical protein